MIGIIENGSYPWLDPGYMGTLPEQPWVRGALFGLLNPCSPERQWQLWEILGHYGDQMHEAMVEAAWYCKFAVRHGDED
jgi:hypothetical protein